MSKKVKFILSVFLVVLVATAGVCLAKEKNTTYILITVDVGCQHNKEILDTLIWGKSGNGEMLGIPKIMDICDSFGVKATFFVNVYEWKVYSEEEMKKVCKIIKDRGHDVQIHTHLSTAYDEDREWPFQYSLKEQIKILRDGKELIHKWIGEYPIGHRAGGYGADYNTLKALKANNIFIDSSMLLDDEGCKLNYPLLSRNGIVISHGVLEIPVTVASAGGERITLGPITLKEYEGYKKVDIDWMNEEELISAIKEAKGIGLRTVTLFMHSWSLVRTPKKWKDMDYSHLYPDSEDISDLTNVLKYIGDNEGIEVVTVREFYNLYKENPQIIKGPDTILLQNQAKWVNQNLFYWAFSHFHNSVKARVVVISTCLLFLAATSFITVVVRRKLSCRI